VSFFRSVRAVASASGEGAVDWTAVAEAAKASTDPGSLDVSRTEREGYATDVKDACDRIASVGDLRFDVPATAEVQNRHHWIDANVATFRRVMAPFEDQTVLAPDVARVANTGSMSFMLAFLARNVLGQYDPLLLAENDDDHGLYFVRPNIQTVARGLDVDYDRFRRWIVFHEVTHAAEFGAAPWLSGYMENRMREAIETLSSTQTIRSVADMDGAMGELNAAMTVVEGYAELLMDRAFDDQYDDLRAKLDARRGGGTPLTQFVRRLLGLGVKRQQYERGKSFFDAVADAHGVAAAGRVWDGPETLPAAEEIEDPAAWARRVL
jgi:uncharacterized protein (DUF2342 family)